MKCKLPLMSLFLGKWLGFNLDSYQSGPVGFRTGNRPVAGVFPSDDCVLLKSGGRTYRMKNCL